MSVTKEETHEIISLVSAFSAIKGYLTALDDAELITDGYRRRLEEYYLKNLESAVKVFTDKMSNL